MDDQSDGEIVDDSVSAADSETNLLDELDRDLHDQEIMAPPVAESLANLTSNRFLSSMSARRLCFALSGARARPLTGKKSRRRFHKTAMRWLCSHTPHMSSPSFEGLALGHHLSRATRGCVLTKFPSQNFCLGTTWPTP